MDRFNPDGRIPVVIGVTGHRNIDDDEATLRALVITELKSLQAAYPNSPFVILSSLAEGADRLVTGLTMSEIGADLVAVLPMPVDDYLEDFKTKASKDAFNGLLEQAAGVVLPPEDQTMVSRPDQYARAGAYVAEYSQVLMTLWDGKPVRGSGGTAEVVHWFNQGFAPEKHSVLRGKLSPLGLADTGLLIHINTRTLCVEDKGDTAAVRNISRILARINRLNRDIVGAANRLPQTWGAVEEACNLLPVESDPVVREFMTPLRRLVAPYVATDLLAVAYSKRKSLRENGLYWVITLALVAYALVDFDARFSLLYLLFFLLAFAGIYMVNRSSIEVRTNEYRSLAEAIRVLFFWRLSGITEMVWPKYLKKHFGLLAWVRHAVRTLEMLHDVGDAPAMDGAMLAEGQRLTRLHWIGAHKDFFGCRIVRFQAANRFWGRISGSFFALSFVTTLAMACYVLAIGSGYSEVGGIDFGVDYDRNIGVFQGGIGILAAVALAAGAYRGRRAYDDLAKQYALALQSFDTAQQKIEGNDWNSEAILVSLGTESLIENGEWLWLKSRLPIELPK
jgi:hypothetical protein